MAIHTNIDPILWRVLTVFSGFAIIYIILWIFVPKAKNEIDVLERAKILKQAEVLLMNDMPLAPILFGISRHLVQEDIEGWIENPSSFHASRYLRRR